MKTAVSWLSVLCLVAFVAARPAAADITVTDATGNAVTVPKAGPVISIGGSVTEVVHALGQVDRVVAVDSTSLYPPAVTEKPDVGYMRQLAAEPILALQPALILAVEDAGPPAVLDQIREAGVPVVLVPDEPTPHGVLDKIDIVAAALGVPAKGGALRASLRAELDGLAAKIAKVSERPRVLFMLSIGQGRVPMAAGADTSAAGIVQLAGGENAIEGFDGYKPLSPEAAVAAAPEVLLITNRSLDLLGGAQGLLAIPEIAVTPAGQAGRVIAMDGLLLLGFGPRTGKAIRQLAGHLHPGLSLRAAAD